MLFNVRINDAIKRFLIRVDNNNAEIFNDDVLLKEYFDKAVSLLTKVLESENYN